MIGNSIPYEPSYSLFINFRMRIIPHLIKNTQFYLFYLFFIYFYFIFHLFQTLFNVDEKLNVVDKLSLNDNSKSNVRLKSLEGKLTKRNDWQGIFSIGVYGYGIWIIYVIFVHKTCVYIIFHVKSVFFSWN